jgi:hypothetical protein
MNGKDNVMMENTVEHKEETLISANKHEVHSHVRVSWFL